MDVIRHQMPFFNSALSIRSVVVNVHLEVEVHSDPQAAENPQQPQLLPQNTMPAVTKSDVLSLVLGQKKPTPQ